MKIPQTKPQRAKAILHCIQAFLIFVAGCLTLAVMTKSGSFGGQTGFYFALCFFTLPAIVYLTMVPMWSRAWRFNNVYAFVTIDVLYAILWFAASIAVAVWNANGIAKGKSQSKDDTDTNTKRADEVKKDGTCASFGYGSKSKCEVSKATVGFGIIIFLLFVLTSYLSIRALITYRKTGALPNANMSRPGKAEIQDEEDPTNNVWSADTDELNRSDDRLPYGSNSLDDQEGLLNRPSSTYSRTEAQQLADGMAHPGYRPDWETPAQPHPPSYDANVVPSALSPTGLPTSPGGRVQFPEADYSALR